MASIIAAGWAEMASRTSPTTPRNTTCSGITRPELGPHEERQVGARCREGHEGGEHGWEGDERQVGDHEREGTTHVGRRDVADVRALDAPHTGVGPEALVQLAVPHVDTRD